MWNGFKVCEFDYKSDQLQTRCKVFNPVLLTTKCDLSKLPYAFSKLYLCKYLAIILEHSMYNLFKFSTDTLLPTFSAFFSSHFRNALR